MAYAIRVGDVPGLDLAAEQLRRCAAENVGRPALAAECLFTLGIGRHTRYERTGDRAALDEAVAAAGAAVSTAPARHSRRGRYLASSGMILFTRGALIGAPDDLTLAIDVLTQAFAHGITDVTARVAALTSLGSAHFARFEVTSHDDDLDAAVHLGRAALREAPSGSGLEADCLTNLSNPLRVRGERHGRATDLDEAVQLARRAVDLSSADRPHLSIKLSNLAAALSARYTTGSTSDLDQAVECLRQAFATSKDAAFFRAACANNLITTLLIRHENSGNRTDLDEALALARACQVDQPSIRPALAMALSKAFDHYGRPEDLDEAIDVLRAELAATPTDGSGRPADLTNLSVLLSARYQRSRARIDLDEATEADRRAVKLLPPGHIRRRMVLASLAIDLHRRWNHSGEENDLQEAVQRAHQAADGIAAEQPDRAAILANYAVVLRSRAEAKDSLGDLDQAITTCRAAVAAMTTGDPQSAVALTALAVDLLHRFTRRSDRADLEEAIEASDRAIAVTNPGHPLRGQALFIRGHVAQAVEDHPFPGDSDNRQTALSFWREAVDTEAAPPTLRAQAARRCAMEAGRTGDWAGAADALRTVVELLEQTVPLELQRSDATSLLTTFAGLPVDAAACCVNNGDLRGAVEVWERSRAVLLGRALTNRQDLSEVEQTEPDLAARLAQLSQELDQTDRSIIDLSMPAGFLDTKTEAHFASSGQAHTQRAAERRRRLVRERKEIIDRIRELPGLNTFLNTPTASALLPSADQGPVVLVNVSAIRCDALILTGGGVDLVPLPNLTAADVHDRVTRLLNLAASEYEPEVVDPWMLNLLTWLWDTTAEPVLRHLGFNDLTRQAEPIWWCVSGLMSFLPLHAAGRHSTRTDPVPRTVIDRVTSSYTPTLGTLRRCRADRNTAPASALVVAMPETDGESDLPGAADAGALLRDHFGPDVEILSGPAATREEVLTALARHPWVHFACHARSDLNDPWASELLLTDHTLSPVTAADLATLRLPVAEFAFLAACSTSRPGTVLPDEAVHLASVLQLAGYRHVIATLWPIQDPIARRITRSVYRELHANDTPDARAAASAVRNAIREARDRWPRSPWAWAGYVTLGTDPISDDRRARY